MRLEKYFVSDILKAFANVLFAPNGGYSRPGSRCRRSPSLWSTPHPHICRLLGGALWLCRLVVARGYRSGSGTGRPFGRDADVPGPSRTETRGSRLRSSGRASACGRSRIAEPGAMDAAWQRRRMERRRRPGRNLFSPGRQPQQSLSAPVSSGAVLLPSAGPGVLRAVGSGRFAEVLWGCVAFIGPVPAYAAGRQHVCTAGAGVASPSAAAVPGLPGQARGVRGRRPIGSRSFGYRWRRGSRVVI